MSRRALSLGLILFAACSPPPSGNDGGAGGGNGGGSSAGGGSGGGSGGGTGGGFASVDAFCAAVPDAICKWEVRCGQASAQAECVAYIARAGIISECGQEEKAAIHDGRASFDGVAGQRCLDALAAAQCVKGQGFFDTNADCLATFPGKVATSGQCYAQLECSLTDYCDNSAAVCPGTCKPRKAAGAATTTGQARECQAGLYNYDNRECLAPVASGGSCAPTAGSSVEQRCASGLYCANGSCAAQLASGASCTDDGDCSGFLVCQGRTSGGGPGTCGAYKGSGQACDGDPSIQCMVDLHCDFPTFTGSGTCQLVGQQNAGCWFTGDCAQGLYCLGYDFANQIRGRCQTRIVQGNGCAQNGDPYQCAEGLYCGGATCVSKKAPGASCAANAECQTDYVCSGTCTPGACFDTTP